MRTLLSLLLVFSSVLVYGQNSSQGKFNFLLKGGVNASQVGGDGLSGFDKLNLALGIGTQTDFSEKFSGRFELNYLQKGSRKAPDPNNNDLTEYRMALQYIQSPLLLRYSHNEKLALVAGPGIGYLISAQESNFDGDIESDPEFNFIDLSLILGFEYTLSEVWSAEIRFDQSIIPIRSKGEVNTPNLIERQFNTVLGIMLSYSIR